MPRNRDRRNALARERYANDPAYKKLMRDRAKLYRRNNPDKKSAYDRKCHTGWSSSNVERAWKAQRGLCAICGHLMTRDGVRSRSTMTADHCHITNLPRALLCNTHNTGSGHFGDRSDLLRRAADYIDRYAVINNPNQLCFGFYV